MHRIELCALCSIEVSWERLVAVLPQALEALGLVHDEAATDGQVTLQDRGGEGRLVLMQNAALARRPALALSTPAGAPLDAAGLAAARLFAEGEAPPGRAAGGRARRAAHRAGGGRQADQLLQRRRVRGAAAPDRRLEAGMNARRTSLFVLFAASGFA